MSEFTLLELKEIMTASAGISDGDGMSNCRSVSHRSAVQCQATCATSAESTMVPIRGATA